MNSEKPDLMTLMKILKDSQDDEYADRIREIALKKLEDSNEHYVTETDMFYVGAIDFMVEEREGKKKFFILETNGGSSRGLSIMSEKQQGMLYKGYLSAIKEALKKPEREGEKILVLVGVPIEDALIFEKYNYIEFLKKWLSEMGFTAKQYNIFAEMEGFPEDIALLIADYKAISSDVWYEKGWVMYKDHKVNVLFGDGIARRIQNDEFQNLIITNFRKINTIIVNPIFLVTDDKSLTYLAEFYAKDKLEKYRVKYLKFSKSLEENDLLDKMDHVVKSCDENFIIKPSGGSGGVGIIPISCNEDPANFKNIIERSKEEFFAKFLKNRNPYPYTIQEMAEFMTIEYKGGLHTYDLRIYLAQIKGKIIPVGGLTKIAKGEYKGTLNKEEFVVNLSGYDGNVEADRGLGISPKMRDLLRLKDEDFVDMFCIGCVLFKSILQNYSKIITFKDWDQILS